MSFWSDGNDINDGLASSHVSSLRRTSSFSGTDRSKEKQNKFKKSKSLNHLTPNLQFDNERNGWKSDEFHGFNSDEADKVELLRYKNKYSSSEINFNQNRSTELSTGIFMK